jgi:uncharacterized damage-inducible protein DinB
MVWRINNAIVRGEIDNLTPGLTVGKIWLVNQTKPLSLILQGDCSRDIAGTKLTFINPTPDKTLQPPDLNINQVGVIGDMTASRKCRVIVNMDHLDQSEWFNFIYLEWFDQHNGRVLIETDNYQVTISEHEWTLDEDQEAAQNMANQHAMRNFISHIIHQSYSSIGKLNDRKTADEFVWEQRLRESDMLTDAYDEVIEKYCDEPDADQKQAFAMGWDPFAMDTKSEANTTMMNLVEHELQHLLGSEYQDLFPLEDDDEIINSDIFGHSQHDPMIVLARESVMNAIDLIESLDDEFPISDHLIDSLMLVSEKLSVALLMINDETTPESGFLIAILKRCLNWQNEAIAVCSEIIKLTKEQSTQESMQSLRNSIFTLRGQIIELTRKLRRN